MIGEKIKNEKHLLRLPFWLSIDREVCHSVA